MLNKVLVQLSLEGGISGGFGIHFRISCNFSIRVYYLGKNNYFQKEKKTKYSFLGYLPEGVVFPCRTYKPTGKPLD